MESIKPSFYGVKGPDIPSAYHGTAIHKECKNEKTVDNSPYQGFLKNLKFDDLLIIGLIILLFNEKNDDNYIMLIILAILLFD